MKYNKFQLNLSKKVNKNPTKTHSNNQKFTKLKEISILKVHKIPTKTHNNPLTSLFFKIKLQQKITRKFKHSKVNNHSIL